MQVFSFYRVIYHLLKKLSIEFGFTGLAFKTNDSLHILFSECDEGKCRLRKKQIIHKYFFIKKILKNPVAYVDNLQKEPGAFLRYLRESGMVSGQWSVVSSQWSVVSSQ